MLSMLHFEPCDLTIDAAAGEAKTPPRFSMVAYTGGLMRVSIFPFPAVVNLEGMDIEDQKLPVRLDHDSRQGVGHTDRVQIDGGRLHAEGVISRSTSWARDVVESGRNGFPWKSSIGAPVREYEFVPEGANVRANGRSFAGPIYVVQKSVLKEISFVDSGADTKATAKVAAHSKETTMKTFAEWLKAQNLDESKLGEDEKKALRAKYETEQPKIESPAPTSAPKPIEQLASPAPPKQPVVEAKTPEPDPIAVRREREAAETLRIEAVRKACGGKFTEIEAKAIAEGWSEKETRVEVLLASRPEAPGIHVVQNLSTPAVLEAAALMSVLPTSRLEKLFAAQVLEAVHRYRGIGIQELGELACGQRLPRFTRDGDGWLRAAFSTVSLPGILSNLANKMLLEGFTYVEDSWRRICRVASVNDFKQHTRYRMTGSFKFQKVAADGELKHGELSEQTFTQQADTHGIMFALTRQMIINDDLGAFTDIPRQIGMGAGEAIADAVWALVLSNPTQTDGNAFFSAAHKNYSEGADTALSVDGLTAAEVLFNEQTKPNGRPLGVPASILLVPTALKVPAQLLMSSLQLNETTTANKAKPSANPHVGKFTLVSSAYLSNASFMRTTPSPISCSASSSPAGFR